MIQEISDPVQGNGSLSASCCALDHHDTIRSVSDDRILLLLDRADNILQLYITVASKLCLQDLIVDLHITLKLIDHFSTADLVLPLGSNIPVDLAKRSLVGSRSLVKIIEQSGHRCSPVIDQRKSAVLLSQVRNSDIKYLRLIFSFIAEIHPSEKR